MTSLKLQILKYFSYYFELYTYTSLVFLNKLHSSLLQFTVLNQLTIIKKITSFTVTFQTKFPFYPPFKMQNFMLSSTFQLSCFNFQTDGIHNPHTVLCLWKLHLTLCDLRCWLVASGGLKSFAYLFHFCLIRST